MKKQLSAIMISLLMFFAVFAPSLQVVSATEAGETNVGKLVIHKLRQADALPEGEGDGKEITPETDPKLAGKAPVAGVGYKIKKTATFEVVKDEFTGLNKINKITPVEEDKGEVYTNDKGVAEFTATEYGRYTFQEFELNEYDTKGKVKPAGITPNTKVYTVEFPFIQEDGTELKEVHAYPKNVSKSGKIKIHKTLVTDPVNNTSQDHNGVNFKLYVKDDNSTAEKPVWREIEAKDFEKPEMFKTNQFTTSTDGTVTVDGLLDNEYAIMEDSSGQDYLPRAPFMTGVVPETDPTAKEFVNDELIKEVSATVAEPKFTTEETIVTVDEPYLYQVAFKVPMDIDSEYFEEFILADRFQQIASKDYAKFSNFDALTMTVDGESVKDHFTVEAVKAMVGDEADQTVGFNASLKKDSKAAMKPYAGKTIIIQAQATVSKKYVEEKQSSQVINDATETIKRRNPFDPPHNPYQNEKKKSVPVKPAVAGLKIVKYDFASSDMSMKLDGAKFKLYMYKEDGDHKGVQVGEEVTTSNGEAKWDNLKPGKYVIEETVYPTYMDNGTQKTYRPVDPKGLRVVEIKAEELTKEHVENIPNRKPEWFIPATGGSGYLVYSVSGLGIILLALILLFKKREKNLASK